MSLLKQILENHLNTVKENSPEGVDSLVAATPQNQHKTSFSLLQNIHGNEITTGDVTNHLKQVDDAEEEVDTVAYGLETTDGQIVKVYVNAEEAEAFEDKMSQMLGKIDDIDQAIEELSDEFDIVKVVKPDDMESEGGEETDPNAVDVSIENSLDEPLTDDDIVTDLDDEGMVEDPDAEKDDGKDKKKDKEDPEEGDEADADKEKKDGEEDDSLSFGDDENPEEDPEDKADGEEDPEADPDAEEDKPEDGDAETEDDEKKDDEEDPEDDTDPKKKKPKKKPAKDDKESKMKEEGTILKQLLALNENKREAKAQHKVEKPKVKKVEPKDSKPANNDEDSVDIFHLPLSAEEQEIDQIFANPIQQLIFRVILLLGVNAEQINVRKFKVRKSVKEVSVLIQHHPQIKNILSKLGKDLVSKKNEIYTVNEAKEAPLTGTIKDQLATEISKKIYDLIISLGVPEFLLTYKKTAFRNRIKNLAKIAVKHSRIKNYIYTLCDLLKANKKSGIKESWEAEIALASVEKAEEVSAPKYVSSGLLEDFSNTNNYADLGTFSVTSMGEVGGTTLKVKDFSVELSDVEFEKLVALFADGKSGIVKSENLGKINLIALARGKEYVIKKIKPSDSDKYAFGVLVSKKSIDKILG